MAAAAFKSACKYLLPGKFMNFLNKLETAYYEFNIREKKKQLRVYE